MIRRGIECTSVFKILPGSAFHSRFTTSKNAALLVGREWAHEMRVFNSFHVFSMG